MSQSLKRYKCPGCDKVSDGTGLSAHMTAAGHFGERVPMADAKGLEVLDRKTTNRRRAKAKKAMKPSTDLVPVKDPYKNPQLHNDKPQRAAIQAISFNNVISMTIADPDGGMWICERVQ